jgi:GNAT superfamily N-acetyltransferase
MPRKLVPTVTLRPARARDLPAIVAMRDQLNDLERSGCPHAAIVPLTLDQFTAIWGPTFDSPTHCWQVIEGEGKLVGFGLIYLSTQRPAPLAAYIHWAYVEKEFRRSGVGQMLLKSLLKWARDRRAERVELQFIDGNGIAEKFWTKMGFQPFARKCVKYLK